MTARLLIVDDDAAYCEALAAAFARRGFRVATALNVAEAERALRDEPPDYALVDLRVGDESGLVLVERAAKGSPPVHVVVLTAYASIATAVAAIKLGAVQYLTKPASVADILAAFEPGAAEAAAAVRPAEDRPSVRRLEWEHIQQVLYAHDGNVSATARALNMHRRTLQRKLRKRPVAR